MQWKHDALAILSIVACLCVFPVDDAHADSGAEDTVPGEVTESYMRDVNQVASNRVTLGYDMGLYGAGWGQGLRLRIPFADHFGLRLRSIWFHGATRPASFDRSGYDPSLVGRVGLYGTSPVLLGVVRLYGGGGPQFAYRPFYDDSSVGSRGTLSLAGVTGFKISAGPITRRSSKSAGRGP